MRSGWLAPNEVRAKENLPPVEGGDSPMIQQQNFSLAALARRDNAPAPAALPAPTPTPTRSKSGALPPQHVPGDVVTHGTARWLCTGPNRYRALNNVEAAA